MKLKGKTLLLACGVMAMASCGRNNNDNETIKYQIDSAGRASGMQQDEINRRRNDSIIMAIATKKADSIEQANKKLNTQLPATTKPVTPTQAQTVTPANNKPEIKEPVRISDPPGAN